MNCMTRVLPPAHPLATNHDYLRQILKAQREALGCLPNQLGLEGEDYRSLLRYIDACETHDNAIAQSKGQMRQQLLELRRDEWDELRTLLMSGRRGTDDTERWLADIVATACLGGDHLWRDLGLPSRAALRAMLEHNFPALALRNDRDMRWKKFFYKQLCEQEGGYVCRAPTCEQCATYADCFGEEA